jgi:hypothetical protein
MTLLGRILKNRRAGETHGDGEPMPLENCAKNIGGDDRSPPAGGFERPGPVRSCPPSPHPCSAAPGLPVSTNADLSVVDKRGQQIEAMEEAQPQ